MMSIEQLAFCLYAGDREEVEQALPYLQKLTAAQVCRLKRCAELKYPHSSLPIFAGDVAPQN